MEIRCDAGRGGADPALGTVLALLRAAVGSRPGPVLPVLVLDDDLVGTPTPVLGALVRTVAPGAVCTPENLRRIANAAPPGGWIAVTMTCRALDTGGAGRLVHRAVAAGMLRLRAQQGFHVTGAAGPVRCRALLTRKAVDIPAALLPAGP